MRRWLQPAGFALGLLAFSASALIGGTTNQLSAQQSPQVDRAYLNGYASGYNAGESDHAQGLGSNPHKFRAYQLGTMGYTSAYGSWVDYRDTFRGGFEDGYADAYNGRRRSTDVVSRAPAPAPAPAPQPVAVQENPQAAAMATANGYREGYSAGEFDANHGGNFSPGQNTEFVDAQTGYSADFGSLASYQQSFRGGFREGYTDGFHHNLYNTAIGGHAGRGGSGIEPGNAQPSHQGGNALPTSPEVERARSSGNYGNGTLLEEGTKLEFRMDNDLSTRTARAGDQFSGTVSVPVYVGSLEAIPAGSRIHGTVESVQRAGRVSGNSQLQLKYETVELPGGTFYRIGASTAHLGSDSNRERVDRREGTVEERSDRGGDVKKIGGGAGLGAIIGAIAGGGKGAAIGGGIGAVAGTAGVLMTRGRDVVLREGEVVTIKLDRPLELRR